MNKRQIRTYLVASGVLRLRDRDRGLRFLFRPIQFSTPEQCLGQFCADPAFEHAIGTTDYRAHGVFQHPHGFIPLEVEPMRDPQRKESCHVCLRGGGFFARLQRIAGVAAGGGPVGATDVHLDAC